MSQASTEAPASASAVLWQSKKSGYLFIIAGPLIGSAIFQTTRKAFQFVATQSHECTNDI
jgi:hypothetical protein